MAYSQSFGAQSAGLPGYRGATGGWASKNKRSLGASIANGFQQGQEEELWGNVANSLPSGPTSYTAGSQRGMTYDPSLGNGQGAWVKQQPQGDAVSSGRYDLARAIMEGNASRARGDAPSRFTGEGPLATTMSETDYGAMANGAIPSPLDSMPRLPQNLPDISQGIGIPSPLYTTPVKPSTYQQPTMPDVPFVSPPPPPPMSFPQPAMPGLPPQQSPPPPPGMFDQFGDMTMQAPQSSQYGGPGVQYGSPSMPPPPMPFAAPQFMMEDWEVPGDEAFPEWDWEDPDSLPVMPRVHPHQQQLGRSYQ